MINRTVLEGNSIAVGEGETKIPEWAAVRLVAVAQSSSLAGKGGVPILTHLRHDLRAGQVVGIVAADGCTLEILPKIETVDESGGDVPLSIRRRLVEMLAVAFDIKIDVGRITATDWQRYDLLECLIGDFVRKLVDAVRRGLPRRYVGCEGDLASLRGRLDVTRQFTMLVATPQHLACRYDILSSDTALNRVMKAAVARLARLSRSTENQRLLRELTFAYADIADVGVPALRWDDVVLDRTDQHWRELMRLAKLLLGERFQTTSHGKVEGFSLLFNMNELFEEYVARMLIRGLAQDGLTVIRNGGKKYCLYEMESECKGRFQTIPDIIIKRGEKKLLIVDMKWKLLSARMDGPKQGVLQSDVYQMMAYRDVYGCSRLMLLYPHNAGLGAKPLTTRYQLSESEDELMIATIDVGLAEGMAERLAALVRRHVAHTPRAQSGLTSIPLPAL